ncbi:unnamed protein product [Periconia digitata]|uniref:Cytochrome P450 n=1 Tax=Periconia digitata TaxID=1303443 RepID=A0A9W4UQT4_9PLEO|nr:unnamed protein product [Periconia digitata]
MKEVQKAEGLIELRATSNQSVRVPPGPRPLPFVGNRYEIYPDVLGNYDRLFSRYGPMFKTVNMGTTIYHNNDPVISRHILREDHLFTKTTSDPSHPLHYMSEQYSLFTCDTASPAFIPSHKFVPPTLSPRAVAHYMPLIQDAIEDSFSVFDQLASSDRAINVYQYMFKLASSLIWRVVFNQDLKHFESPSTPPSAPIRYFDGYLSLSKKSSMQPTWLKYLPFGYHAKLKVVRQQLFDACEEAMLANIDKDGPTIPLADTQALLSAKCLSDFLYRAVDESGERLPYNLVVSNLVVTAGAGFATTSSLLSWALYALVRYPGNQDRLYKEIAQDIQSNPQPSDKKENKRWTYDEIHGLKFLDAFLKEVLRLHSPNYQTARNAKEDVVLPGGYLIPKGSVVMTSFPSIHKNPKHWDNPLRFDPDRWLRDEELASRMAKEGGYTPFGAGARGCVGFNLALAQAKLAIVELVHRYTFEDESTEAVVYDPDRLVVRPMNLYAGLTKRGE